MRATELLSHLCTPGKLLACLIDSFIKLQKFVGHRALNSDIKKVRGEGVVDAHITSTLFEEYWWAWDCKGWIMLDHWLVYKICCLTVSDVKCVYSCSEWPHSSDSFSWKTFIVLHTQTLAPFSPPHSWPITMWSEWDVGLSVSESYRNGGTQPSLIHRRKGVWGAGFRGYLNIRQAVLMENTGPIKGSVLRLDHSGFTVLRLSPWCWNIQTLYLFVSLSKVQKRANPVIHHLLYTVVIHPLRITVPQKTEIISQSKKKRTICGHWTVNYNNVCRLKRKRKFRWQSDEKTCVSNVPSYLFIYLPVDTTPCAVYWVENKPLSISVSPSTVLKQSNQHLLTSVQDNEADEPFASCTFVANVK